MIYVIKLRPNPGVDGIKALRRALKYALRVCGLKCLSAIEQAEP
ncbi:MAG TPA: hypothetical protein VLL28_08980 [Hyphomicrobiaceae bacterium]|nr:hypothetical protein [Hyphomicrobiaceae bacterium]